MTIGIYYIRNTVTRRSYIGQSVNIESEWIKVHRYRLRKGIHPNKYLQKDYDEFGEDSFIRDIICECNQDELGKLEQSYIKEFHTHVSEGGYNISWGGDTPMLGRKHSQKTKDIMSEQRKGRVVSDETKEKIRNSKLGIKRSKETVEKMIKNHAHLSGSLNPNWHKPMSEETKEKMRKNLPDRRGNNNPSFGKKRKGATSKFFGVSKQTCVKNKKEYSYWIVYISVNTKLLNIGHFKDEMEAARCYDKYVIEHNLPNPLNFPK